MDANSSLSQELTEELEEFASAFSDEPLECGIENPEECEACG